MNKDDLNELVLSIQKNMMQFMKKECEEILSLYYGKPDGLYEVMFNKESDCLDDLHELCGFLEKIIYRITTINSMRFNEDEYLTVWETFCMKKLPRTILSFGNRELDLYSENRRASFSAFFKKAFIKWCFSFLEERIDKINLEETEKAGDEDDRNGVLKRDNLTIMEKMREYGGAYGIYAEGIFVSYNFFRLNDIKDAFILLDSLSCTVENKLIYHCVEIMPKVVFEKITKGWVSVIKETFQGLTFVRVADKVEGKYTDVLGIETDYLEAVKQKMEKEVISQNIFLEGYNLDNATDQGKVQRRKNTVKKNFLDALEKQKKELFSEWGVKK